MRLDLHPAVRDEAADAKRYYNRQEKGLGRRFTAALREVFVEISANPYKYGAVDEDIRAGLLKDFPYAVYYRTVLCATFCI